MEQTPAEAVVGRRRRRSWFCSRGYQRYVAQVVSLVPRHSRCVWGGQSVVRVTVRSNNLVFYSAISVDVRKARSGVPGQSWLTHGLGRSPRYWNNLLVALRSRTIRGLCVSADTKMYCAINSLDQRATSRDMSGAAEDWTSRRSVIHVHGRNHRMF